MAPQFNHFTTKENLDEEKLIPITLSTLLRLEELTNLGTTHLYRLSAKDRVERECTVAVSVQVRS